MYLYLNIIQKIVKIGTILKIRVLLSQKNSSHFLRGWHWSNHSHILELHVLVALSGWIILLFYLTSP